MYTSNSIVFFEAVVRSKSNRSMFSENEFIKADDLDEFMPTEGRASNAANELQKMGFRVRHIGTFSISAEGPRELWEKAFNTKVEVRKQLISEAYPDIGEVSFLSHVPDVSFEIPAALSDFIDRAYPQRPPILFESPLPPRVKYHHLRVPDDVATVLKASKVHKTGIMGSGVLVAMPDTGFYKHPFYSWHGFSYNATLSPDAIKIESDEYGHGTAEAANIFANAPKIDFMGVKMGNNTVLGFKTASDLHPGVITCSWGYSIKNAPLPNYLKPLEAAVIEAVKKRGITVCFSAGNGHYGFPAQMPEVIAAGGVYSHENMANGEFKLEASDYSSSFDSQIYPGRHVPDVCGLVGMLPRAIYIMLPVEPGDYIDRQLSGASYPNKDETAKNDGWAVISGTSAASPQIAGVCALLKEIEPALSPSLIKSILKATARDVKTGQSQQGQPAGEGHDGATGAGLVDAYAVYKIAKSIVPRDIFTIPAPR